MPSADAATLRRSRRRVSAVARDLMMSTRYYEIEGTPLAARLERWVRDAQRPGWWTSYDDEVIGGLDAHLAYEVDRMRVGHFRIHRQRDPGVVYIETRAGYVGVEGASLVESHHTRHHALMRALLIEEEPRNLIRSIRDTPRNCL